MRKHPWEKLGRLAWKIILGLIYSFIFLCFFSTPIWIQWSNKRDDLRSRAVSAFRSVGGFWNRSQFSFRLHSRVPRSMPDRREGKICGRRAAQHLTQIEIPGANLIELTDRTHFRLCPRTESRDRVRQTTVSSPTVLTLSFSFFSFFSLQFSLRDYYQKHNFITL